MKGICSVCQTVQPIVNSPTPSMQMEKLGYDDYEMERQFGESIYFLVVSHEFYGEHCDGSNQIPETVLKD